MAERGGQTNSSQSVRMLTKRMVDLRQALKASFIGVCLSIFRLVLLLKPPVTKYGEKWAVLWVVALFVFLIVSLGIIVLYEREIRERTRRYILGQINYFYQAYVTEEQQRLITKDELTEYLIRVTTYSYKEGTLTASEVDRRLDTYMRHFHYYLPQALEHFKYYHGRPDRVSVAFEKNVAMDNKLGVYYIIENSKDAIHYKITGDTAEQDNI